MRHYRIALIPGDGVGPEVIPVAVAALRAASRLQSRFTIETADLPWSCAWYLTHGQMMPADGLAILAEFDAILLGAVGYPGVPDHVSLRGLLLPIRQSFQQYVNLRPIELWAGARSPLRDVTPADLNLLCIRENTEGEYVGIGGRWTAADGRAIAVQTSLFSESGVERVVRYAFERARERRRLLASATKSNALQYTAVLWDEVVQRVAADYPDVSVSQYHVDALAARFVTAPSGLDVVVASNLFGDILTDLGAALQGSLGMAASANLNPEHAFPSMFEPVHGSAPDIAGRGIANPIGAIHSAALMLDHLGEGHAAGVVTTALRAVVENGPWPADMGGSATTAEVGDAVINAIESSDRVGMPDTRTGIDGVKVGGQS